MDLELNLWVVLGPCREQPGTGHESDKESIMFVVGSRGGNRGIGLGGGAGGAVEAPL